MIIEWECPCCGDRNYVGGDWETCLQMCEGCESESEVELKVSKVKLQIGRGKCEGQGERVKDEQKDN